MPRCTIPGFVIKLSFEGFENDNEKVFYCETTNEIFRDYEEYFQRIMLINSTVWTCEITGTERLTYIEALQSEKKAIEQGKGLREILKAPILLLVKIAPQQSSYCEFTRLLYQFFKKQYLIGEIVFQSDNSKRKYKIIDIIKPKDGNTTQTMNKYKLKQINNTNNSESVLILPADQIKRLKNDYSYNRIQYFLKENTELIDGIICTKDNIYKKYVTDQNITFQKLFVCELPQWTAKKKLSEKKDKSENKVKLKQNESSTASTSSSAVGGTEDKKSSLSEKDKKQKTLTQYVVKSNGETNTNTNNIENMKKLMQEMERKRKEHEAKQLELERKKAELNEKVEKEIIRILIKCDDLERDDQKPLPQYKPVKSIVSHKYFGDLLKIQEFLHSFSPILSAHDSFPNNVTFHQMCRALTVHEIAGPLSDILQVLLSTIFSLQIEENGECSIEYQRTTLATTEPQIMINRAIRTHSFVETHYSHEIFELPIDSLTLSEIIRLHLLSSGAETTEKCTKWRYMYRNGYSNSEDPGLYLCKKQPHILRALKMYSIYQLPMDDIIKIINCLIDQIHTYQSTISILEERTEKLIKLQHDIRNLYIQENKRIMISANKKKQITTDHNLKALDIQDSDEKKKIMNDLDLKISKIIIDDDKGKQEHEYQVTDALSQIFDHMINLGSDRCYRQYFIFESLCGLFIEHPTETFDDNCLDNPPQNCMELSNLPHIKAKMRPFLMERFKEMEKENSKKYNNSNTNGANKENSVINGILNRNLIAIGTATTSTSTTTTTTTTSNVTATTEIETSGSGDLKMIEYGPEPYNPSQYELYMCTGNQKNCIVHNKKDPNRCHWSFIHTEEDLEALIGSLNPFGIRESALREKLIKYKSLILKHILDCPVNELTIGEKISKDKFLNQIKSERKYQNSNFGFQYDVNIGDIMYNVLLDKILQFENDISRGHLGKLKVKDVERWRSDLLNNAYDPQCKNFINDIKNNLSDLNDDEYEDPGNNLGNTTEIKSDNSCISSDDDDLLPLHDSPELRKNVQNLAMALLQIEQGIEQKFLKEPFGIKNESKDKELNESRLEQGRKKLKYWESSLLKSTSYSQIFLHINVLLDAVKWTKSSNHARCIKCKKKSADQMLLCDECNAGMHMYCMEPKLTAIPKGNWYCKKCIIKLGIENKKDKFKTKKKVFKMDDDDDETCESPKVIMTEEESENNNTTDSERILSSSRKSKRNRSNTKRLINNCNDNDDDEDTTEEVEMVNNKVNRRNGSKVFKQQQQQENEEEECSEEEEEEDEDDDEEEEELSTSSDSKICKCCGYEDGDIVCSTCNCWYHLECIELRRVPRGSWNCENCREKMKTRDRSHKRKIEEFLSDSSLSAENDEKYTKRNKYAIEETTTTTRNLRKRNSNDKRSNGIESRRSRHIADNSLPLNNIILYELLDGIMKHEDSWPFLRPVQPSQVRDYYDVIKKPMDFGRIKSNLNMGKYRENSEVMTDIELVFRNCDLYNTAGNDVYRAGKSLEHFVYKKCKELKLLLNPSDMIKNEVSSRY